MNRYVLEFEKDGGILSTSFDAIDDDKAKTIARERLSFLREVAESTNKELRHPELYRQIYGL
ncbi:MAG: hypothetical protein NUW00_05685 [Candidatus Kaiserbacteria bacterium]|nr:hypothetical protein [Candidatus Kaiserbacteria bacterium]